METVAEIDKVMGKTRMGQTIKLEKFQKMLAENLDLARLYQAIELR